MIGSERRSASADFKVGAMLVSSVAGDAATGLGAWESGWSTHRRRAVLAHGIFPR